MGTRTWRALVPAVVLAMAGVIGCGDGSTNPQGARGPSHKEALLDLAELLKGLSKERGKPPATLAQLERYEPPHPGAVHGVRHKEVEYLWGAGIATGGAASTTVVAYETKAPAEGGWVLLQDGSVKEMSADEFKAAPKAK